MTRGDEIKHISFFLPMMLALYGLKGLIQEQRPRYDFKK